MELQHMNVKLLLKDPASVNLAALAPVFHSWIQDQILEGTLLDVADYRHVVDGPGVILIAHDGDYGVDNTNNRLGVRYNRKIPLSGSNQDRLTQAARAALAACQLLENDPALGGQLRFNEQDFEIFSNDRLLAPNTEDARKESEPEFHAFAERLFGGRPYSLSFDQNRRRLLTVFLRASQPITIGNLAKNLASWYSAQADARKK